MRLTRLAWIAYAKAVAVIALDQISKAWVLGPLDLPSRGQIPILPPVLNFTLVHNSGVSFHLLAGGDLSRWGLTAFSLVVAAVLGWWARSAERLLQAAGIGLIMGGAVGNALDRIRLGHVTDFIDVSGLHFPWVFNVADAAISVGVGLLLLESLLAPKKPEAPATTGAPDPDARPG